MGGKLVRMVCCEGEGYAEKQQKKLVQNEDSEGRILKFETPDAG